MFKRPAFLDRLTNRLQDLSSLHFRVQAGAGLLAGGFGVLLVLVAVQLDARRCEEVARTEAETLARTAGLWLDGDAHAGLGSEPEKRLSDLGATLAKLVEASDYPGVVRTLRPKAEQKAALTGRPDVAREKALEVVLQTGSSVVHQDVDYRAPMRAALFDGKTTSTLVGSHVVAYAPVPDSWGATPAMIAVEGPAQAPLWRRVLFAAGASLVVGLLVWAALLGARRAAGALTGPLREIESALQALAAGRMEPITLPSGTPRELARLAESLDFLRARLEAGGRLAPPPAPLAPAEAPPPQTRLGEPSEFDLALLMQQLVEPARKLAQSRGIDVQLVFPDGLPSQLVGHPIVLYRALDSLLRSALRTTRQGRITLRVSRAGAGAEGAKLRFEVSDTSAGVAFKEQQELTAALADAAGADPNTLQDPLQHASALANALGGGLSFVSQPGQGSRFGFSVAFAGLPASPTGFHPQEQTGFQGLVNTAFQTRNGASLGPQISSFQPRPALRKR
jgi:signal transduction histidine kinase